MPMLVPSSNLLHHVNGVFNAVMVWGDGFDQIMFYGRGAGAAPTASAVVTDIVATLRDGAGSFAPAFAAGTAENCQRCIGRYHRFCKGKWNRHCTVLGFCFR